MAINKNTILARYALVMVFIVLILGLVIYRIVKISFIEGDQWRSLGEKSKIENIEIEPTRGNIFACDGRLMASSIPQYQLFFDFKADGYTPTKKISSLDSLTKYMTPICNDLATIIGDKTPAEYKNHILKGLNKKSRQFSISNKKVSYLDMKKLRLNPFFKMAPGISGFYSKAFFKRKKPFGSLASRTIGDIYSEKGKGGKNGLELQFDSILRGTPGLSCRQKIRSTYLNYTTQEPVDGMDIHTTIDVNIQDISERALVDKLKEVDAESGTIVLMEVETGEVKAITNMMRVAEGEYYEGTNMAVNSLTEPGSTFKVASMMVALDDGKVQPNDVIFCEYGQWHYSNRIVKDHNWDKGGYGDLTAAQTIWNSSNIGVAKIIDRAYHNDPKRYVDKLYAIGLNKKLDFQIPGTAKPVIKYPTDASWSNTTLAWMSFGYETQIPPIYMLTFYNSIANNGKMVKPFFVKSINRNGTEIKKYETEVVNPAVCKPSTVKILQQMLADVVVHGTGKPLLSKHIKIAGKTGTAQVSQGKAGYDGHQVSFCGYFPVDKPKYSGIVVIRYPRIGHAGGGTMAGPVFKQIAEQVYARSLRVPSQDVPKDSVNTLMPSSKVTFSNDLQIIFSKLSLKVDSMDATNDFAKAEAFTKSLSIRQVTINKNVLPNVIGMGVRDAVYLLENMGMKVVIMGSGTVVSQSPTAGQAYTKGEIVKIVLK
ncbi:MAG: penicillin-binding protein [Bacteroidales bacterium]|nr:penicillin-binding protein [Bacteroidales bacterium]